LVLPTHRTSLSVLDADGVVQSITSDSQRIIKLFATDRELFYTIRRPSNFFVSTDESLEATSIKDSFLTLTSIFKSEFGFILVDQKSQEITVKLARDLGALASNDLSDLAVFKTWFSSFAPRDFVEFQNEVYFVAGTPQRGTEIWKTNGTPEGTVQVTSFPANPLGSAPTSLAVIGDQLFFAADDGVHGYELWSFSSRGDANLDGVVDAQDIDMLFAAVDGGVWQPSLDLNGDDTLDQRDVDVLVQDVLRTRYGDLNLDQKVDFADFLWLANSFADDDVGWSAGRTSVDQSAGRFASFLQLSTNFGFGLPGFDAE
jgi:ELWxxDGT repeat protein